MANNFVNMEEVQEIDQSLDFVIQPVWSGFLDGNGPPMIMVKLNEVKTELYDDRTNFMGLGGPKKLHYLNADDKTQDLPFNFADFAVLFNLSNKTTI